MEPIPEPMNAIPGDLRLTDDVTGAAPAADKLSFRATAYFFTIAAAAAGISVPLLVRLNGHTSGWIAFLVLGAVLAWRFLRTGGPAMLWMMGQPAGEMSATEAQVKDPVCGMTVDPMNAAKSEYEGQAYYFCSTSDKEAFDEHPERYANRGEPRESRQDERGAL